MPLKIRLEIIKPMKIPQLCCSKIHWGVSPVVLVVELSPNKK